jgi:OmpA-OmpF porin, OOP family
MAELHPVTARESRALCSVESATDATPRRSVGATGDVLVRRCHLESAAFGALMHHDDLQPLTHGVFLMKKQVLLAAAALALSGAAAAQTYGVISVGSSKHSVDCEASNCDKSGTAFKLLGGYKFNPNLALEAGYMSFGKSKDTFEGLDAELSVNGFGIGGAFHQDFATHWNFVARLGLAQMKTKGSLEGFGSISDSTAQLYGGLGVGYKLTKQMSIDAAWDFSKGELEGEKGNVNAYSIGLTFAF